MSIPPHCKLPQQARIQALALLACVLATSASAVLWSGTHWAVSGAAEAGAGYDSNLFARAGGDGDSYVKGVPTLMLKRLHSLTRLEAAVSAQFYGYVHLNELNRIDPALTLRLRYPAESDSLAVQEFEAKAEQATEANSAVGGRLRYYGVEARWNGNFQATGKIAVLPDVKLRHTDYLSDAYNTNDSVRTGITLAHVAHERLQLGAGYAFEYSRSSPDISRQDQIVGRQHAFFFRGRGEFLPKIAGNVVLGMSHYDYSGGYSLQQWDPVAIVSLTWEATARGKLVLRAERQGDFSPNGSALTRTGVTLEWTQEISGGFSVTAGAGAADVGYNLSNREDHQYEAQFALRYALTDRFSAGLNLGFNTQDSDSVSGNYDRSTVYGRMHYHF